MALGISLPTNKGIDASFWIISKVDVDRYSKTAYILMYGYMNKDHCDSGGEYLTRLSCGVDTMKFDDYFNLNLLDEEGKNQFTEAYRFVKENDSRFTQAEDLIYDIK